MDEEFKKPNRLEGFKTFLQISIAINILIVAGTFSYSLFTQQKLDKSLLIADISAEYKSELEELFGRTQPKLQTITHYAKSPLLQFTYEQNQLEVFQDGLSLWLIYEIDGQRYYTEILETMPTTSGDLQEVFKDGNIQYRHDSLEEDQFMLITKAIGSKEIFLSTTNTTIPAKALYAFLSDTISSLQYYEEANVAPIPLTFSKHGTSLTYSPTQWIRQENTVDNLYLSSYSTSPSLFNFKFSPRTKESITTAELNLELEAVVAKYAKINQGYQWEAGEVEESIISGHPFVSVKTSMQYLGKNWERVFYIGTTTNVGSLITIVTTAPQELSSPFEELISSIKISDSTKQAQATESMEGEESLKISMSEYIAAHSIVNSLTQRCDTTTLVDETRIAPEKVYKSCSAKTWITTSQTKDTDYPLPSSLYYNPLLLADLRAQSTGKITPQNIEEGLVEQIKEGGASTDKTVETAAIGTAVEFDELTHVPFSTPTGRSVSETSTISRTSLTSQVLDYNPLHASMHSLSSSVYHTQATPNTVSDDYNSIQFSELGQLLASENIDSDDYNSLAQTFKSLQRKEYILAQNDSESLLSEYIDKKEGTADWWELVDLRSYEPVFESFGLQFNNQKLVIIALALALLSTNILLVIITSTISFILRKSARSPVVGDPFAKENLLKKPQA